MNRRQGRDGRPRVGWLTKVSVVVALVAGGTSSALGAETPPLVDPQVREVQGKHVLGGCDYAVQLVLPVGQRAIEERVLSEDPPTCTARFERGIPTQIDGRLPGGTEVTTTDAAGSGSTMTSGPLRNGRLSVLATTKSSGWYKTWYQDPPTLDVNNVRSTVTWNWNNTSTSTVTCAHSWWWLTASGWSRTDNAQACSNPGQAQSETYGRYYNGTFCFPNWTRTNYWPTYAIGRKNGDLVGNSNYSKSGYCTGMLSFRHQLVRTLN